MVHNGKYIKRLHQKKAISPKMIKETMSIGDYIKALRIKKGISPKLIKEVTGVSLSTLYRIEAGNVPHLESLEAIAKVLGVKPSTILKACGK